MDTIMKTKHKVLLDKLVKRMKNISYMLDPNGFDEPMLYDIAHRIYKHVDDFSKITVRATNKDLKIKKDITNKKIVKFYNLDNKKGSRIKYENVIPVWGYPTIGKIVKITEENEDNLNVIHSEIIQCNIEPGIYVVLKEVGNNSVSYINGNIENKFERRYHIVLMKID